MTPALVFAIAGLALTVSYFAVFVALHVLPSGYRPISHAVSDYAVGKYGYLFRVGLWVSALGTLALAVALHQGVGAPPLATKDIVFLILIALARVGMTAFPTDLEGQGHSRTGLLHYVFAIAAFTFTYLAISDMTSVLRTLSSAPWTHGALHVTGALVAPELALVVITMIPRLRRAFGLSERLFLLTTNIWFVLASLLVIARTR
jgi:vacuolar-type H+-ATPase subunit I/STV1